MEGVYREIVAARAPGLHLRLENEQGEPGHQTLVTVTFAEQDGKTLLTFHQAVFEIGRIARFASWRLEPRPSIASRDYLAQL